MKVNFFNIRSMIVKYKIKKCFKVALDNLGIKYKQILVNIGFAEDDAIKRLNKKFRGIDKVTDVLSFPLVDLKVGTWLTEEIISAEKHPLFDFVELGDILISENVAKEQAKKYGHSTIREVVFLAVHGLLHILGFDHEDKEEEEKMNALAKNVLTKAGVSR